MAGRAKYSDRMAKHVGEPIEGAAPITAPGGAAMQIGGGVGGLAGAAVAGVAGSRGAASDIPVGRFAWLGVGPQQLVITKASLMGKPTGDPLARIPFADVTQMSLTEGKITMRVDLDLRDGRHVAFETKRLGPNKPNVEVLELLQSRCSG